MKIRWLSILPIFLLAFYLKVLDDNELDTKTSVSTGILLDTLANEVYLALEDDLPLYYYSNIFTPVCNTGECLPVKINIYWDLKGNFIRFDQEEGEILTKLDHVPFTQSDYNLLDEILRGSDPRESSPIKSYKSSSQDNESSPAPEEVVILSKYEMVDGITGSTLPKAKDKFVPGALYTTHTLWGLANDHRLEMRKYTQTHLMQEQYFYTMLTSPELKASDMVIEHLTKLEGSENGRDRVLLSFLDTGDVALQKVALNKFYWDSYRKDEVSLALHNKFYGHTDISIRKVILHRWAYNFISPSSLQMLAVNVHNNQDVFPEILAVFSNKQGYNQELFETLIDELPKLELEHQQLLIEMFVKQKDKLSGEQWKVVKQLN